MLVDWSCGDSEVLDADGWGFGAETDSGVLGVVEIDSSVVFVSFFCFKPSNKLTSHRLTPGWVIDPSSKLSCNIRLFIDIRMSSVLFRVYIKPQFIIKQSTSHLYI